MFWVMVLTGSKYGGTCIFGIWWWWWMATKWCNRELCTKVAEPFGGIVLRCVNVREMSLSSLEIDETDESWVIVVPTFCTVGFCAIFYILEHVALRQRAGITPMDASIAQQLWRTTSGKMMWCIKPRLLLQVWSAQKMLRGEGNGKMVGMIRLFVSVPTNMVYRPVKDRNIGRRRIVQWRRSRGLIIAPMAGVLESGQGFTNSVLRTGAFIYISRGSTSSKIHFHISVWELCIIFTIELLFRPAWSWRVHHDNEQNSRCLTSHAASMKKTCAFIRHDQAEYMI